MKGEDINELPNAREARGEIIDLATRELWQDTAPTPRAWWDALKLETPLARAGYGSGNRDRMWFRRSPDAERDRPCRTREISGPVDLPPAARP